MLSREKNEFGYISLNKSLLDQICTHALQEQKENVWLANYKGPSSDPMIMFRGFDGIAEKEIRVTEGKIFIRLYVVVRFGQSISTICEALIGSVRRDIVTLLEIPEKDIEDIQIAVTGVLARRLAQRDLEFSLKQMKEEGRI